MGGVANIALGKVGGRTWIARILYEMWRAITKNSARFLRLEHRFWAKCPTACNSPNRLKIVILFSEEVA